MTQQKFELEVLLLGDKQLQHMFMCFKLSDSIWIRYDNARGIPFQYFDFNSLYTNNDVYICSAIYVNSTLAKDYKHGIPETGLWVGAECFCLSRYQQILSHPMDQKLEQDLETLM
ncbi:hypothetical protein QTP86_021142, partial [Hemibagrus guttatus]